MSYFEDPTLDNPFWRFSLDRYTRPGVATTCLEMQERVGIDVNLLLFAFWLGQEERRVTHDLVALDAVAEWHETVVRPLRHARVARRPASGQHEDPIRSAIKLLELQAEQIEQALLYRHAKNLATVTGSEAHTDMMHNAQRLIPALAVEGDALRRLASLCL
ncbi:TIGR02444 family protein [Lentibacter sp. XHP0401]|uniref:TIGR02444 family protein n=1 Tax=Lentibacter sp. XHP0401 TaxID=2984334 RepID=UPI0021E93BAC|nr:TIGR02444 family protein [Lentibacter sp. XHP0401]MCV2894640.1 TIGR02444 family protein [Lentibacter sp. XHP0401]